MSFKRLSFMCFILCLMCNLSCQSLFWQNYKHPAFFFEFKHPKRWKIVEDSQFQTQLSLIVDSENPIFQPNINFVIQAKNDLSLQQIKYISVKQLTKLLNNYQKLSETNIKISGFDSIELRSKYTSVNDPRIIRTLLLKTDDLDYTITFTCREMDEKQYLKSYLSFIKSLKIPKSVQSAL